MWRDKFRDRSNGDAVSMLLAFASSTFDTNLPAPYFPSFLPSFFIYLFIYFFSRLRLFLSFLLGLLYFLRFGIRFFFIIIKN